MRRRSIVEKQTRPQNTPFESEYKSNAVGYFSACQQPEHCVCIFPIVTDVMARKSEKVVRLCVGTGK